VAVPLFVTALLGACAGDDTIVLPDAGTDGMTTSDVATTEERRNDSNEIPCPPRRVLTTICQQCHTRPETKNGAPFPLVYRSDIIVKRGASGTLIRELMVAQLKAGTMPYPPVTITETDKATLLSWLSAGAFPVEPQECNSSPDASTDAKPDTD
jgi:hypothetical protein